MKRAKASHHIRSIKDSWSDLKKLKDLYDSQLELELIQLLLKLQPGDER